MSLSFAREVRFFFGQWLRNIDFIVSGELGKF